MIRSEQLTISTALPLNLLGSIQMPLVDLVASAEKHLEDSQVLVQVLEVDMVVAQTRIYLSNYFPNLRPVWEEEGRRDTKNLLEEPTLKSV